MHYADTSALVKLVSREAETDALVAWLRSGHQLATSDLARTELLRAVRRARPERLVEARELLQRLTLLAATAAVFDEAARLDAPDLRSLDAVHLASALQLGDDLETVVTYDDRLAAAAASLGIPVTAPR